MPRRQVNSGSGCSHRSPLQRAFEPLAELPGGADRGQRPGDRGDANWRSRTRSLRRPRRATRRLAQKVVKKLRPHVRDHQVSVNIVSDVPETLADPRRIEQVLHNLIINATKYSPEGTPILVRVERRGSDVLVSIRDQGIGIPQE